jgi:hypothetical protein
VPVGIVRALSNHYADGLERMEIWIKKSLASSLPFQIDKRIPIILTMGTETYEAGLRATEKTPYIWICPDLKDRRGKRVSLARVLKNNGMRKSQMVNLEVDGYAVRVNA